MHILLLGTSSVGKSTISQYFKDIGYTHISCDDYVDSVDETLDVTKYYSETERTFDYATKNMFLRGKSCKNNFVLYDDCTINLLHYYQDYNLPIVSVLLYSSVNKIINNVYNRRTTERRAWPAIMVYTTLYEKANINETYIDEINKNEFINALKQKLMFIFESVEDLEDSVNQFFANLGCSINEMDCKIKLRNNFKPTLFIKTNDLQPQKIFNQIIDKINSVQIKHSHILLFGSTSSGKTEICKHLKKFRYFHIDNNDYITKVDKDIDTNQYYMQQDIRKIFFSQPMFLLGVEQERVIYDDVSNNLVELYKNNNKPLFTIFLHLDIYTIIQRLNERRFYNFRDKYDLISFTKFYTLTNSSKETVTTIQLTKFKETLKTLLAYLFVSSQQLDEYVISFFNKLNINNPQENDTYNLKIKDSLIYDLMIDSSNKTPQEISEIILSV